MRTGPAIRTIQARRRRSRARRLGFSAMGAHEALVADDDEMSTAFDEMKAAAFDLGQQCVSTHFALYIPDRASHDPAFRNGFCSENARGPRIRAVGMCGKLSKMLHRPDPTGSRLNRS